MPPPTGPHQAGAIACPCLQVPCGARDVVALMDDEIDIEFASSKINVADRESIVALRQ
jgi:hypothetical protein